MSQAPTPHSFRLISGTELVMNITVKDENGTAQDITGASVRFAMARTASDTILIDSDASPQTATAVVTDAASGVIQVTVTDEVTEDLLGDYWWACKMTSGTGRETTVARGWISVEANLI